MLNYSNLNDNEFEYLCQDIMSRKLNKKLRMFATGRDGGIDLTDDVNMLETIIQVKHYMKTNIAGLINSLKKELHKLKKISPKNYYVCCSKELTAGNIKEIYNIFSEYMRSDSQIITLIEIDNFLKDENNKDILRKHYKLWLSSTGILDQIYNNNIFIDSEVLLYDIKNQVKLFVNTSAYEKALDCLKKSRILFLTGEPGVGKTITSKMLIMNHAAEGYKVRYTTDGLNLSDLKKSLSQNKEEKEIILLDDCFGQIYFNMKETQANQVVSLIKYVSINPNKILILNSRVTIFSEAKQQSLQLVKSLNTEEIKVNIIDMNQISILEKAKILYNHIYFYDVPKQLVEVIKEDKNYLKIIEHKNYSPRIIEFICNSEYDNFNKEECLKYIMNKLDNPSDIWEDEYERKLSKIDRLLITTIYSLTLTAENYNYVEKVFNKRIEKFIDIDVTKNNFNNSLKRLQNSIIKIIDIRNQKMISMINPSVNDYLNTKIYVESPEYEEIVSNAVSVKQLERLVTKEKFNEMMQEIFSNHLIDKYIFPNNNIKNAYITWYISQNNILDNYYQEYIIKFLKEPTDKHIYYNNEISIVNTLKIIFSQKYIDYYNIKDYFDEFNKLYILLEKLDLKDVVDIINITYNWFDEFEYEIDELIEFELDNYLYKIDITAYDIDISRFIKENERETEFGTEIDDESVIDAVYYYVKDIIDDEIYAILSKLPNKIKIEQYMKNVNIDHLDVPEFVQSYIDSFNDNSNVYYNVKQDADVYRTIELMFKK